MVEGRIIPGLARLAQVEAEVRSNLSSQEPVEATEPRWTQPKPEELAHWKSENGRDIRYLGQVK